MEDKTTWDCVKKPFQVIVTQDSATNDIFLIGFGLILSSPLLPPPLAMLWPKKAVVSTHGAQNSTWFGVGGEG